MTVPKTIAEMDYYNDLQVKANALAVARNIPEDRIGAFVRETMLVSSAKAATKLSEVVQRVLNEMYINGDWRTTSTNQNAIITQNEFIEWVAKTFKNVVGENIYWNTVYKCALTVAFHQETQPDKPIEEAPYGMIATMPMAAHELPAQQKKELSDAMYGGELNRDSLKMRIIDLTGAGLAVDEKPTIAKHPLTEKMTEVVLGIPNDMVPLLEKLLKKLYPVWNENE